MSAYLNCILIRISDNQSNFQTRVHVINAIEALSENIFKSSIKEDHKVIQKSYKKEFTTGILQQSNYLLNYDLLFVNIRQL